MLAGDNSVKFVVSDGFDPLADYDQTGLDNEISVGGVTENTNVEKFADDELDKAVSGELNLEE